MSKNTASISALVSAIQGGLNSGQTYDLMRQITDDLSSVSDIVESFTSAINFDGTNIVVDPEFIASPGDLPQLVTTPGRVAFINWPNIFQLTQTIKNDLAELLLETITGSKDSRVKILADDSLMISENIDFDGSAYSSDGGTVGASIEMTTGEIRFNHWTGAALLRRLYINTVGALIVGIPGFIGGGALGEIVLENTKSIISSNAAGSANTHIINVDANDIIRVGASAVAAGTGHFAIPFRTAANLPAAGANQNGTIVIDQTNHRICWYDSNLRYFAAGTAF